MGECIGNEESDSHYEINSREIAAVVVSLSNTIFKASLKRIHENTKSLAVTKVPLKDPQRIEEKEKHRKKEEEEGDEES